ncbi:hypothetical protein AM231_26425 [Paenibacillus solani]|uniref:Copper amine oxidase-like N-terminal domain-containing protein n=2 Tax=Paenibacillus solani TaxID=1705565 RepID=A0A0M1N1X3_9BACL|nr:hypothetical protein AM231_26425 [Paenibacillus solani]
MIIIRIRRISLFVLMSVLVAASFIWNGEQAAAKTAGGYTVEANGSHLTDVYIHEGKTYVPLKSLALALGYEVSYSLQEEFDNFHHYDLNSASSPLVSIWGNANWGYTIVRRAAQEMSVNDVNIYTPSRLCPPESDNCSLDESKYEGPFLFKNTLYVPVRDMAKAFNLKLTITLTQEGRLLQLSPR